MKNSGSARPEEPPGAGYRHRTREDAPPDAARSRRAREALYASAGLSDREREVADLLLEGASNRAIALRLGISEHTVKAHTRSVLKKFNVPNRHALFRVFALREPNRYMVFPP